jgi:hypothetical protein
MSNYRKTMADALREMYPLDEETQIDEGVFDPKDGEKWAKEIQKGIKAPVVGVKTSSLGGEERMSIMVKFSMEKEASKGGTAFFNSRYANVRVDIDGSMEMFQASHKFGIKKMRKAKIKSAKDVIKKINDWIVKVPSLKEEVDLDEAKPEFEVKYAKSKGAPIKVTKFMTLDQAKKFLDDVKKDGMNGIISKGGKPVKEEADLDEASKLPPHLAKFFDKDGNLKKDAAARIAKGQQKLNIKDVTPKGYGPSEEADLDENLNQMKKHINDIEFDRKRMTTSGQESLDKLIKAKNINDARKAFDDMYGYEYDRVDSSSQQSMVKVGKMLGMKMEEVDLDEGKIMVADPKTQKVIKIDEKDWPEYEKKGYVQAEGNDIMDAVLEQLAKIRGNTPGAEGRRGAVEDDIERAEKKGDKKEVEKLKEADLDEEGLEDSPNKANSQHLCAKNVVHEEWGEGHPVHGMHDTPNADGNIAWYDVMFEHGIEKGVSINELKVIEEAMHSSHNKDHDEDDDDKKVLRSKYKKEEVELDEAPRYRYKIYTGKTYLGKEYGKDEDEAKKNAFERGGSATNWKTKLSSNDLKAIKEDVDLDEASPNKQKSDVIVMKKDNSEKSVVGASGVKKAEKDGYKIQYALLAPSGKKVTDPKGIMKAIKGGDKLGIGEEVDLDEGKMSQLHQYIKDKKSPEEIAKMMKLDVKTVKSLMANYISMGYSESAASDARKAMSKDKDFSRRDSADDDTDATDADIKGASKNIIMQLRKAGNRASRGVEFADGKKVQIPAKMALAVQQKYNSLKRPADKEKFQAQIAKSYKDMLNTLKAGYGEQKESILDRMNRKIKENKNG